MIVSQPPPQMALQMNTIVGERPGAAGEWSDQLAQSQVGALDEGGLDGAGEVKVLEQGADQRTGAEADAAEEKLDAIAAAGLEELSVEQARVGEPVLLASSRRLLPEAEVSGQCIEIVIEPIAGEDRKDAWPKAFGDLMDHLAGIGHRAASQMQPQNEPALSTNRGPDPDTLRSPPDLRHQFVKLDVR